MKEEKSNCCNAPLKKYLYGTSKETGSIFKDKCSKCDNVYPFAEKFIEDPNHPYGGMGVVDNEPKKTWENRFDVKFGDLEHMENGKVAYFRYDSEFQKVKNFFQQELDRISKNFMTEFVDPDTNLLNISKYDHKRIINFFNQEIK